MQFLHARNFNDIHHANVLSLAASYRKGLGPRLRLPQGQYGYSGHVVNLPQDVASFVQSLPRLPSELDVIEPSGLPCQTCSGAQSSPVAGHTQPVLPLSRK